MIRGQFHKPFNEQVRFFRQKLNLPTNRYDDLVRSEHDHAFVVASAMKAGLLADLRGAVDKAISEGKSLGAFRKEFREIVARRGWTGWKGEDSQKGTAWRTRMIYKTNMDTSYMAGRWQQMTDPDVMRLRPYWRYVHNTVENPRQQHRAWHGLVLPAGDPWFKAHYPPNGYGCNCGIETLSERDLERLGKAGPDTAPQQETWEHVHPETGEVTQVPKGLQYGWDYAPGASAAEKAIAARQNRLEGFDNALARKNVESLVAASVFQRFWNGELAGEFPVAVLKPEDQKVLNAESQVVLLSQDSLAAHLSKHPEIDLQDYRRIQQLLDNGEVYRQSGSDERLVYLTLSGVLYRAALKRTGDGRKNYFLTLFKTSDEKAEREVRQKMERVR
ncbi:hypothetical protein BFW38_06415 [Terasakiispira papahanaumokuakeensis]|uniref:Phage head morphogenesis domain-containing protein n=1 Tax=Terasakiispira papahanaumokuakeensis TaxID=197479 RepID=A0A1E2V884_9GAMM|nr:phage minor head protein [Terasakiispira papahanaumokuakeensis]ODC03229.1 hypothetical protein BFW38_06415 [Terasakiispira papahanaumokuakeensis]